MKKKVFALVVVLFSIGLGYVFYRLLGGGIGFCLDAETDARNIFTNECKIFPNSCIPRWYKADISCPGGFEILK